MSETDGGRRQRRSCFSSRNEIIMNIHVERTMDDRPRRHDDDDDEVDSRISSSSSSRGGGGEEEGGDGGGRAVEGGGGRWSTVAVTSQAHRRYNLRWSRAAAVAASTSPASPEGTRRTDEEEEKKRKEEEEKEEEDNEKKEEEERRIIDGRRETIDQVDATETIVFLLFLLFLLLILLSKRRRGRSSALTYDDYSQPDTKGGGGGGLLGGVEGEEEEVQDGNGSVKEENLSSHPSYSKISHLTFVTSPLHPPHLLSPLHPQLHPRLRLLALLIVVLFSLGEGGGRALSQEILEVRFEVEEEVAPGTFVGDVAAEAGLVKIHGSQIAKNLLQFKFLKQQHALAFQLDSATGILRTGARIDRDSICPGYDVCSVRLDVAVQPVEYFRIVRVTVFIRDVNDNSPSFLLLVDGKVVFDVLETAALGTGLVVPSAIDVDSPRFSVQSYALSSSASATPFELREIRKSNNESIDLRLVLTKFLDRETVPFYDLTIGAVDGGLPPRSGSLNVHVNVLDVNDNNPVFERDSYSVTVAENIPRMTTLVTVRAFDADSGLNGQVVYEFPSMTASSYGHLFSVGNVSGQVVVIDSFDYELIHVYHLVIVARDLGPDAVHSTVSLTIHVEDINDNPPEISIDTLSATPGAADIDEELSAGAFVALVSVTDRDSGPNGQFNCSLNNPQFILKTYGSEFHIVTAAILDRELQATYDLALVCTDFGDDPQASVEHVTVRVTDVNDLDPVFRQTTYYGELIENNYIGAVVFQVNASDGDLGRNAEVFYEIEDGPAGQSFEVDRTTGLVKALVSFDHEATDQFIQFRIVARDNGSPSRSSSASALITILDINDEIPKFTLVSYSFRVDENEPQGTSVGTVNAYDADSGPSGHVVYAIQSGASSELFTVDQSSGTIQTTVSMDREVQAVHDIIVTATDHGVPALTSSAKVTIQVGDRNDNAPLFDNGRPANATLFLSTAATIGHLVTKITALDADSGVNAKVNYDVTTGHEWQRLFEMDSEQGMLRVAASLEDLDGVTVELTVTASDCGHPIQSSVTHLYVSINSSVPYQHLKGATVVGGIAMGGASSAGGGANRAGVGGIIPIAITYNLAVVVSLAVISGLVTTCLVIAIACVRRQDSRKKQQRHQQQQPHQHHYDDNAGGGSMGSLKVISSRGQGHAEVNRSHDTDESSSDQSTPARTKRSRTERKKDSSLSNGSTRLLTGSYDQMSGGGGTRDNSRAVVYHPTREKQSPPVNQQVSPLSSSVLPAAAVSVYRPLSTTTTNTSNELEARRLLHATKDSDPGTGGGGGAGAGGRGGGCFYGDRLSVHSAEGSDSGRGTTSDPEAAAEPSSLVGLLGGISRIRRSPPSGEGQTTTPMTSQMDQEPPGGYSSLSHCRLLSTVPEDVTSCHDDDIAMTQLRHCSRALAEQRGATIGRFRPLSTTSSSAMDSSSREIVYVANASQEESAASPLLARERFRQQLLPTRMSEYPVSASSSSSSGDYANIPDKPCGHSRLHTTFARWKQQQPQREEKETMRLGDIVPPGEYCDMQYQILLQSGRSSTV